MNQPQLPAYLQNRQSRVVSDGAADGIGGSLPPHISIRGNEFTLIDAAGNKQEVDEKYLDVCFVDRSDVVCKQYYEQDYVDGANDPPTCFSANGIAPSIEASQPQSPTCATCQWNVRGSDVSKISGKAIKACRDEKWTAVILLKYPAMIFQFRVTPGSFVSWKGYVDKFKGQATDLSDVVTRLAFEKGKNGVLTFEPVSYIDQVWDAGRQAWIDRPDGLHPIYDAREAAARERKTDVLVGRLDRPIQAALTGPRPAPAGQAEEQRPLSPPAAGPAPNAGFGSTAGALQSTQTAFPAAGASPSDGKRKRRTKAEIEAANAAQGQQAGGASPAPAGQGATFGGGNAGPAPFRPAPPPEASAAPAGAPFGIATHAVAPDPAMTAMLGGIFGPAKAG